jgi:hypothetical protein
MPRYFLHIRNNQGDIEDSEGLVLADLEAARREAVAGARSILCEEVMIGQLHLDERIDIENERRELLLSVHFRDVVQISEP